MVEVEVEAAEVGTPASPSRVAATMTPHPHMCASSNAQDMRPQAQNTVYHFHCQLSPTPKDVALLTAHVGCGTGSHAVTSCITHDAACSCNQPQAAYLGMIQPLEVHQFATLDVVQVVLGMCIPVL